MWEVILILAFGLFFIPMLIVGSSFLHKLDKDIEDVCPLIKKQNAPKQLENGTIYFPSRRSLLLTVLTWSPLLAWLTLAAYGQLITFVLSLIVSILILWLETTTGYTINSTHLVTQFCLFRSEVKLETLATINKSNTLISAPALSLKRLEITTINGELLIISPVEEELFLKSLKERSPSLLINLS